MKHPRYRLEEKAFFNITLPYKPFYPYTNILGYWTKGDANFVTGAVWYVFSFRFFYVRIQLNR